ncbi:hypothetical protein [Parapedobacter pyrenivorans]|nr:hypothetical protein [Parapedobacter pyrenivorans]
MSHVFLSTINFLITEAFYPIGGWQQYDFGEGIVKINMYSLPGKDTADFELSTYLFQPFTYHVKGGKVLRLEESEKFKSDPKQNLGEPGTNEVQLSMITPSYLMDFDNNTSYLFHIDSNGTYYVYQQPLEDFSLDVCYKVLKSRQSADNVEIVSREPMTLQSNPDKMELKVLLGKDTCSLQYVALAWPVNSPLNSFLPNNVNGNVCRMITHIPGTSSNGNSTSFYALFVVEDVEDMELADSLFQMPQNAVYVDSMQEIMDRIFSLQ